MKARAQTSPHLKYSSAEKLMNILKRPKVKNIDSNIQKMLDKIAQSCETCMTFSRSPHRLRVTSPPEKFIFSEEVAIDLMWLEGKAILHVVDCRTHFNSASQFKGHSVEDLWEAYIERWSSLYAEYSRKLRVDQELLHVYQLLATVRHFCQRATTFWY